MTPAPEEVVRVAETIWPTAASWARFHTELAAHEIEDAFVDSVSSCVMALERSSTQVENLRAYIFKTFMHRAARLSKLAARRPRSIDDASSLYNEPKDGTNLEDELEKGFLIAELLSTLDVETRFVVEKHLLGYTYEEISKLLHDASGKDYSPAALRKRLQRATDRLQERLIKLGITSF